LCDTVGMSPNITPVAGLSQPTRDELAATVTRLTNIRYAVRATLVLGLVASVAANVLHAQQNLVAECIAGWPPVALLLTVELISRIPVHRRGLAVTRVAATAIIAGIAGWVSYWHMAAVCSRYGESPSSAHLIPFSVDGLIVVASVCLVELADGVRTAEGKLAAWRPPAPAPVRDVQVDEQPAAAGVAAEADAAVATALASRDELAGRRQRRDATPRRGTSQRRAGGRSDVSDEQIVAAITPYVMECRAAGVAPVQREMVRRVADATGGHTVRASRCVAAAELVRDVESAQPASIGA
jgi:hypothetical protein